MIGTELLRHIVPELDRGDAPDCKWPDHKGEYWALCPFHPDRSIGSFSVSERGYNCFSCGESGGLSELAAQLGIATSTSGNGLTLAEYATAKRLPLEFLRSIKVREVKGRQRPYVLFDYLDEQRRPLSPRMRFSMNQSPKSRKGGKAAPYGLWRLSDIRKVGWVLVLEGESDCHTAWLAGIPALGLPGATSWQVDWARYFDGLQAYIWKEPDHGGETMVARLRASLSDARVIEAPEGITDLSQAHCEGADVVELVERLKSLAEPINVVRPAVMKSAETLSELASWVREQLARSANRETKQRISEEIAHWLLSRNRLLLDMGHCGNTNGRPYLVSDDGALWPLERNDSGVRLALHRAGLNRSEPTFAFTLEHLAMTAMAEGQRVPLSRWTDARCEVLYVSCGATHIVRARDGRLERLPNGTDGIWFAGDAVLPEWTPTEPVRPLDVPGFQPALEAAPEVPAYSPERQRILLVTWLATLLSGVRPVPLLICLGQRGGGKTTLARSALRMLFGPSADLTTLGSDVRDLESLLTSKVLVGLDNLDAVSAKWLPDTLAAATTGVATIRRRLFTDSDLVTRPATAAIIVTTRSASFARADVAERSLPILTGEFADSDRLADSDLLAAVDANRDGLLSWCTLTARNLLKMRSDAPDGLPLRFQDFARCVYSYLTLQECPGEAEGVLLALRAAQALTIGEADPLAEALVAHIDEWEDWRGTATDLMRRLQDLGAGLPHFGGGKAIARRLREIRTTLALAGINLSETKSGNQTFFSLQRVRTEVHSEKTEKTENTGD